MCSCVKCTNSFPPFFYLLNLTIAEINSQSDGGTRYVSFEKKDKCLDVKCILWLPFRFGRRALLLQCGQRGRQCRLRRRRRGRIAPMGHGSVSGHWPVPQTHPSAHTANAGQILHHYQNPRRFVLNDRWMALQNPIPFYFKPRVARWRWVQTPFSISREILSFDLTCFISIKILLLLFSKGGWNVVWNAFNLFENGLG